MPTYHKNRKVKWRDSGVAYHDNGRVAYSSSGTAYHDNGKVAYSPSKIFYNSDGKTVKKSSFRITLGKGIILGIVPKISAYGRKID